MNRSREYRMVARAESTARTARAILEAAVDLWREGPIDEITLEAIAERAGVSARTILRRFGSKQGVITACLESDAGGVRTRRDMAPVGDVDGALAVLLEHYESDGDPILRTLALEETVPEAGAIVKRGREEHRQWCARVFGGHLPRPHDAAYGVHLDAFVAATDVYLWKLLRRDLGRTPEATRQAMRTLLDALMSHHHRQSEVP